MAKTATIMIAFLILLLACTQNQRARQFGGTATINLPANQKLVVATWKNDSLWYLTRPMRADESPESYWFQEDSSFGIMQGTVIFHESKGDKEKLSND